MEIQKRLLGWEFGGVNSGSLLLKRPVAGCGMCPPHHRNPHPTHQNLRILTCTGWGGGVSADAADGIRLRIVRWEIILDYLDGPSCNHMCLCKRGRGRLHPQRRTCQDGAGRGLKGEGLESWRVSHKPRNASNRQRLQEPGMKPPWST